MSAPAFRIRAEWTPEPFFAHSDAAPDAPAPCALWTLTYRGDALGGAVTLPISAVLGVHTSEAGEVWLRVEDDWRGRFFALEGAPLTQGAMWPWRVGQRLAGHLRLWGHAGTLWITREAVGAASDERLSDRGLSGRGPSVEVALGPELEGSGWLMQAAALGVAGAWSQDAVMRRVVLACLEAARDPSRAMDDALGVVRAVSRALGRARGLPLCNEAEAWERWAVQLPVDADGVARWVDAWLADRRALAIDGVPPWLALACPVRAWVFDRHAGAPQRVFPLRCAHTLGMTARGLEVWPSSAHPHNNATLAWRWERGAGRLANTAPEARLDDGALLHVGDAQAPRELRYRTREAVIVCGWGPGERRVSVVFEGPEMTLGGEGAEVVLDDAEDAHVHLRHTPPDTTLAASHAPSEGRFEVVDAHGHARSVRVMMRQGEARDVWSVGPWRFALERWPMSDRASQTTADAPNTHVVRLRELLMRCDATDTAWSDVLWQAGACRAAGVAEVAGDYLDTYGDAWPAPWNAPSCACGRWSRWANAHVPAEVEARRACLERLGEGRGALRCVPRAFLATDSGGGAFVGCVSWLGWGAEDGALWAVRTQEAAPSAPRWRYVWDVDARAGVVERLDDVDAVIEWDGAVVNRAPVVHGQVLRLDGRRVEVSTGVMPLRVCVRDAQGHTRTVLVRAEHVRVGRGAMCDVVLRDDPRVSRMHLSFEFHQRAWFARDSGSSGGVYLRGAVGGHAERMHTPHRVRRGDVFLLGAYAITLPDVV